MDKRLRTAAIAAVSEYMGIAAEFVVDDALAEVDQFAAVSKNSDNHALHFFAALAKQLPPEVPYASVKSAILKSLRN